ncbi:MAG: hypothetical protein FJ027_23490 [Candidatus Rokubacteria bacterium]|nr:hypothetical protein [Candidatus Rokubacteria bacterium]
MAIRTGNLIYAGDTPLACSITVEQTGPMRLTVRAGSYTMTGRAQVLDYRPVLHDRALRSGRAELVTMPARVCWPVLDDAGRIVAVEEAEYSAEAHDDLLDGGSAGFVPARTRVRVWENDVERASTHVLVADQAFDFDAADVPETWRGLLVKTVANVNTECVNVLMQSRFPGGDWPEPPQGWVVICPLIWEFTLEPGARQLPDVLVLTVKFGFPPGTEPEDWREQRGDGGGPVVLPVQVRALGRALQRARAAVPA